MHCCDLRTDASTDGEGHSSVGQCDRNTDLTTTATTTQNITAKGATGCVTFAHLATARRPGGLALLIHRDSTQQTFFTVGTTVAVFPLTTGVTIILATFWDTDVGVSVCGETAESCGATIVVGWLRTHSTGVLLEWVAIVSQGA